MEYTEYIKVNWPDSQDLMEEDWFSTEAILDNRDDAPSSSYLIPKELYEKYLNKQNIKKILSDGTIAKPGMIVTYIKDSNRCSNKKDDIVKITDILIGKSSIKVEWSRYLGNNSMDMYDECHILRKASKAEAKRRLYLIKNKKK